MVRPFGILAVLALAACEPVTAGLPPSSVAGTYVMVAVTGRGPAEGSVALSSIGAAERRVRYRQSNGSLSAEYVARGTFQVRADRTVDLRLREDAGRSPYVWRPLARVGDGVFVLRHPDPADGPDIIETYERQP